jgi:hypothetical protein
MSGLQHIAPSETNAPSAGRRAFLDRVGKTALATPAVATLIMSGTVLTPHAASAYGGGGEHGHGGKGGKGHGHGGKGGKGHGHGHGGKGGPHGHGPS